MPPEPDLQAALRAGLIQPAEATELAAADRASTGRQSAIGAAASCIIGGGLLL